MLSSGNARENIGSTIILSFWSNQFMKKKFKSNFSLKDEKRKQNTYLNHILFFYDNDRNKICINKMVVP